MKLFYKVKALARRLDYGTLSSYALGQNKRHERQKGIFQRSWIWVWCLLKMRMTMVTVRVLIKMATLMML